MAEFPREAEKDPPAEEVRRITWQAALGLAILLSGVAGLGYALFWIHGQLFPAPENASLAVAAYFDPVADATGREAGEPADGTRSDAPEDGARTESDALTPAQLKVEGRVQTGGQPVKAGQVKVKVRRLKSTAPARSNCCIQSILLDIKPDGKFETGDVEAFKHFHQGDHLHITVEAWYQEPAAGLLTEYIHLGGAPVIKPPIVRQGFLTFLFLTATFGIWFLWVFTGPGSRRKNRGAIILSYIVACTFLGIPLIAPVLLTFAVPDLQERLEDSPVGLVKRPVGNDKIPQWALTIGVAKSEKGVAEIDSDGMQGGLVIPFYVLILSILGGAINMTRQVPRYHRLGTVESPSWLESLFQRVTEESPEKPEDTLIWRRGLVSYLMALLSAPVLAIATYYLLLWLKLVQVPILVLVSFSVGLISEDILIAIKNLATKIVGTNAEQTIAGPTTVGPAPVPQPTPQPTPIGP